MWNVFTYDNEGALWQIRFLKWDEAERRVSSWEEKPWLLTLSIVSESFISLYFNRGIICFKWNHIDDRREAYCPPFMSLIKDTERYCSSRRDWGESTIALPHLHKASIHPFTSQDSGLHQPEGRSSRVQKAASLPTARYGVAPKQADLLNSDSQLICFVVHFHWGNKGLLSLSATHRDERIRVGEGRQR